MKRALDEVEYEQISDTERWRFRLLQQDLTDPPHVNVSREVRESPSNEWTFDENEGVYQRTFERDSFNKYHYENFRSKFAEDPEYREEYEADTEFLKDAR